MPSLAPTKRRRKELEGRKAGRQAGRKAAAEKRPVGRPGRHDDGGGGGGDAMTG